MSTSIFNMGYVFKEWLEGWRDFAKTIGSTPKEGDTIWTFLDGRIVPIVLDNAASWAIYNSGVRFPSESLMLDFVASWEHMNSDLMATLLTSSDYNTPIYLIDSHGQLVSRHFNGRRWQLDALVSGFASFDYAAAKHQRKRLLEVIDKRCLGKYFVPGIS